MDAMRDITLKNIYQIVSIFLLLLWPMGFLTGVLDNVACNFELSICSSIQTTQVITPMIEIISSILAIVIAFFITIQLYYAMIYLGRNLLLEHKHRFKDNSLLRYFYENIYNRFKGE